MAKRAIRLHLYKAEGSDEEYQTLRFVCGDNTDTVIRVHRDDLADVLKAFRLGFWQVFFDEALLELIWKQCARSSGVVVNSRPSVMNSSQALLT